jgi:hypothetical protein
MTDSATPARSATPRATRTSTQGSATGSSGWRCWPRAQPTRRPMPPYRASSRSWRAIRAILLRADAYFGGHATRMRHRASEFRPRHPARPVRAHPQPLARAGAAGCPWAEFAPGAKAPPFGFQNAQRPPERTAIRTVPGSGWVGSEDPRSAEPDTLKRRRTPLPPVLR